jgi:hypothetical protein
MAKKPNLAVALHEAGHGAKVRRLSTPATITETKPITVHLAPEVRDQLKILAAERRTTILTLVCEGLNSVFAKYGKPEIAVPPRAR